MCTQTSLRTFLILTNLVSVPFTFINFCLCIHHLPPQNAKALINFYLISSAKSSAIALSLKQSSFTLNSYRDKLFSSLSNYLSITSVLLSRFSILSLICFISLDTSFIELSIFLTFFFLSSPLSNGSVFKRPAI